MNSMWILFQEFDCTIDELEYDENDMLVNKRADKIKKLHAEFMSITNRMKRANCGFPTDFVFHHKIINKTRQTNGEMQFDIQLLLNKEYVCLLFSM